VADAVDDGAFGAELANRFDRAHQIVVGRIESGRVEDGDATPFARDSHFVNTFDRIGFTVDRRGSVPPTEFGGVWDAPSGDDARGRRAADCDRSSTADPEAESVRSIPAHVYACPAGRVLILSVGFADDRSGSVSRC
jgi:hypothetical protein